jgi:hypothetical protein
MRIGFVNIFSFRPHIQNLVFLSELLEREGHECFFLTCDSDVNMCYNLLIKSKNKLIDCPKCMIGGLRSFYQNVDSIKDFSIDVDEIKNNDIWVESSLATAYRVELPSQLLENDISKNKEKVLKSVNSTFNATKEWIKQKKLNGVICFNGRMDLTRGIIEACKSLNIPFLTHESSWFGHGITLVPNNNCLASSEWLRLNEIYQNKPLSESQLSVAISVIAQRFLKKSKFEWRQYNDTQTWQWRTITPKELKILILPSSRSEFMGEDEYNSQWSIDSIGGFEKTLDRLSECGYLINVVVKAHPIWGQSVYGVLGNKIENYYKAWANDKKFTWLGSEEQLDTQFLLSQCNILIINGSSVALEAGVMGKPIICTSNMIYTNAGFTLDILNDNDLKKIPLFLKDFDTKNVIRKALRFIYTCSKRFPQFVDGIVSITNLENRYFYTNKTNGKVLIDLLLTGQVKPFDNTYDINENNENKYIDKILEGKWNEMEGIMKEEMNENRIEVEIKRRKMFTIVDKIRKKMPKGDEI